MKKPLLQDDALLAQIRQTAWAPGELRLWWLGQSGFLVQESGRHLLLDPYLSDSLTQKYASTDKPHVRMTGRVIAPERLDFIDVVTSSHNHTDHLDAATLIPLVHANPEMRIVCPQANLATVSQRCGLAANSQRIIGLDDGDHATVGRFEFHGIASAHNLVERDGQGRCLYLGYVVKLGGWTIYHSGDTLWYEGMVERLRRFKLDVALLPINGNLPQRRVAGNLDGIEAARLAKEINAGIVIPCHYDLFEFNTASPDSFVSECEKLGQRYVVLENGGCWKGARKAL